MSCETFVPALLQAAADGLDALSAADRDALRRHLEQCAECRRDLEAQRAVRAALTSRVDAEAPVGLVARVVSEIDAGRSWVELLRWRTWTVRLAPVAAGLLILGLVTARDTSDATESVVGVSELAESWAFGEQGTTPVFTLWGQDDVAGDLLLDAVLSADPDERLGPRPGADAGARGPRRKVRRAKGNPRRDLRRGDRPAGKPGICKDSGQARAALRHRPRATE